VDPSLSVIIPTKNRNKILQQSLDCLKRAVHGRNIEIIIVNDGDDENILDQLWFINNIKVIKNQNNGVASARNMGASISKAETLLFMDDDMLMTSEGIDYIIGFHKNTGKATLNLNWMYPEKLRRQLDGLVFGRYLSHFGFTSLKGWNKDNIWNDGSIFETTGVTSQNLSMRKSTFIEVGGYNESFPYAGFEDYDLSKRITENGIRMYIDPTVNTYHNEADRQNLLQWMERKYRSGFTRGVAAGLGNHEVAISHPLIKRIILRLIFKLSPVVIPAIVNPLTNGFRFIDPLVFRIINLLLAAYIFKGYEQKTGQ